MTAAKVMDITSRLCGRAAQAAETVSAYTQVKKEDTSKIRIIPKSECPDIGIRLSRHKWSGSWSSMEESSRSSWAKSLRSSSSRTHHGKVNSRKLLLEYDWEKQFLIENIYLYKVRKDFSFLCICMIIMLARKKQNIDPMWKVLNKQVHLGEPASFLDHVYLGFTQRQCETSKDIVDNYRTMFESRISCRELRKKLRARKNWVFLRGPTIWKIMSRNVRNVFGEFTNKTTQQLYKVSTPCLDEHQSKEEELESVREVVKLNALKFSWNVCIWHSSKVLILHGLSTNLHVRSQNGSELVTIV